mgnify:CR=1 FL=1
MKLDQLLPLLSVDQLKQITIHSGILCGTHSKRQMVEAIGDNFRRPEFLRQVIQHWKEEERASLVFVLMGFTRIGSDMEWPFGYGGGIYGMNFDLFRGGLKSHVQLFCNCGFLLPQSQDRYGVNQWVIADEVRESLLKILGLDVPREPLPLREEPAKILDQQGFFIRDVFSLLVFAWKDKLRMASSGEIYKRSAKWLEENLVGNKMEAFDPLPEHSPDRIRWMIEFLLHHQILYLKDRDLVPTRKLEAWLSGADMGKHASFYHFFIRDWIKGDIFGQKALDYLKSHPSAEGWILIDDLARFFYGAYSGNTWWLPVLRRGFYVFFHILCMLGFVRLALFEKPRRIGFQLLPLGGYLICGGRPPELTTERAQITVQPDYELFVSPGISLADRWQIEKVADLISSDRVLRYRISRESVYRGLKWGSTPQSLIAFLQNHAVRPLPQNVLHSLEAWSAQYGNIAFADGLLLRCQDDSTAQQIKLAPDLARFIRAEISPRDFIISRKNHKQMIKLLERHGHMPKPGVVNYDLDPEEEEEEEGWFGSEY